MKRLALAILPVFILATSPAYAWWGGPWSNNTPNYTATGTFEGVVSGVNVTGVMIFGYSSTSSSSVSSSSSTSSSSTTTSGTSTLSSLLGTSGNEGRTAIFIDGYVVTGNVTSTVDFAGRSITGVLEASKVRSTQILTKTVSGATSFSTGNGTNNTGSSNTENFKFTDVEEVAGDFTAHIDKTYPSMTFSGSGTLDVTIPTEPYGVTELVVGATLDPNATNADTGTVTTKLTPNTMTTSVTVTVSGVKTSNAAPTFTGSIQVQSSSVEQSATTTGA